MRLAGIVLACSAPLSGLLSFAFVSVVFGEERLEGASGLTAAGSVVLSWPLFVGIGLALWNPACSWRSVGGIAAAIAVAMFVVGLWSVFESGRSADASIGGGLLVLASVATAAAAYTMLRSHDGPPGA